MTLTEFIEKTIIEKGIDYQVQDIEDYIFDKAKKEIKGTYGAIDDETITKWILDYTPDKKKEKKTKILDEPKETKVGKPVGITKEIKGEWGEQQSLF